MLRPGKKVCGDHLLLVVCFVSAAKRSILLRCRVQAFATAMSNYVAMRDDIGEASHRDTILVRSIRAGNSSDLAPFEHDLFPLLTFPCKILIRLR